MNRIMLSNTDSKSITIAFLVIVLGTLSGAFTAYFSDTVFMLPVIAVLPILLVVYRFKLKPVYLLMAFLPVMYYVTLGVELNISVSDFIMPIVLILIIKEMYTNGLEYEAKEYKIILIYGFAFIAVLSISLLNVIFYDRSNTVYGVSNIFKIAVNIVYSLVVLFYLTQHNDFQMAFLKVWNFAAVVFSILCITGVVLYASGFETPLAFYYRARGTFQDSNLAACYLNLSLGIVLSYNQVGYGRLLRYNTWLLLFALFLTASRGAILGLLSSFVIVAVTKCNNGTVKKLMKVAAAFTIFIIIAAFIIGFAGYSIIENVDKRILSVGPEDYNTTTRLLLWKTAFSLGVSNPLTGIGTGQFKVIAPAKDQWIENIPHNTYLGTFAETGLLGFMVLMSLPVFLFVKLNRKIKEGSNIALLLTLSLLSTGIQAFTINIENFRVLWVYFAFILFYCNGKHSIEDKSIVY